MLSPLHPLQRGLDAVSRGTGERPRNLGVQARAVLTHDLAAHVTKDMRGRPSAECPALRRHVRAGERPPKSGFAACANMIQRRRAPRFGIKRGGAWTPRTLLPTLNHAARTNEHYQTRRGAQSRCMRALTRCDPTVAGSLRANASKQTGPRLRHRAAHRAVTGGVRLLRQSEEVYAEQVPRVGPHRPRYITSLHRHGLELRDAVFVGAFSMDGLAGRE